MLGTEAIRCVALDLDGTTLNSQGKLSERTRQAIRAAIDALPEHHRTVILLRELDGMSYQDIAKVMGLTEGTVKSRINRARAFLRNARPKKKTMGRERRCGRHDLRGR